MKLLVLIGLPLVVLVLVVTQGPVAKDDWEEIRLKFPNPWFWSGPVACELPNLETPDPSKVIKSFLAPKGTINVAQGKKVTSSDPRPVIGNLALITDGDASTGDDCFVELAPGRQWVQIDLEKPHRIQKIAFWHSSRKPQAYIDVIIQVSDDPDFKTSITLFNNDHNNDQKMGAGKDPAYIETNHGRVIDGQATQARYVRLYSAGNTYSDRNQYCEVQVFAVPAP